MNDGKLQYPGIVGSAAGVVAVIVCFTTWWSTADTAYKATADVSGTLALAMAIGTFAFGGAYVLMSDARIHRAMGVLMTLCSFVLANAALWATTRADSVAAGASSEAAIWFAVLLGAIGVAAGVVALRDVRAPETSEGVSP
jgi:hypothetical protein